MRLQGRIAIGFLLLGLSAINALADYLWWSHVVIILNFLGYSKAIQPITLVGTFTKIGGPSGFLMLSLISAMVCFKLIVRHGYGNKIPAGWTTVAKDKCEAIVELLWQVTSSIWIFILASTILELVLLKVLGIILAAIIPVPH